jgi:hypothetical protein
VFENVEDQNQSNTIVEFSSAFDLSQSIPKSKRVDYLKQLHLLYRREYVHTLPVDGKGD